MTLSVDDQAPHEWQPHVLAEVECFNQPRTAFIGRAVAVREAGLEFIVMAKNAEQLDLVTQNFLGLEIDADRIYKATMISSEGITLHEDQPFQKPAEEIVGHHYESLTADQQGAVDAALAAETKQVDDAAGLPDPVTPTESKPWSDDDEL